MGPKSGLYDEETGIGRCSDATESLLETLSHFIRFADIIGYESHFQVYPAMTGLLVNFNSLPNTRV
jgi:hypothetical protein